jgi:energy-coupling factor transporter transmembrane protein EcfT
MVPTSTLETQGVSSTTLLLFVLAGVVVVVGMPRPPHMPDRVWRFFCWEAAGLLAVYAVSRIPSVPTRWIWLGFALILTVAFALAFWTEKLRDRRETETAKESSSAAVHIQVPPARPLTRRSKPSPEPIFDEAPLELAVVSQHVVDAHDLMK